MRTAGALMPIPTRLNCLPWSRWAGVLLEAPDPAVLSPGGWAAMAYMAAVPMGACYPVPVRRAAAAAPATASMETLPTPLVGVVAAAIALGEPLGARGPSPLA